MMGCRCGFGLRWWCLCLAAQLGCGSAICGEPLDTWHWRNPIPTGNSLYGLSASADRYVAVGELGTILVSEDGNHWFAVESGTQNSLRAVACGNGNWVAVGDFGEILTSADGITWTPRPTEFFFDLLGITWGGGLFVAVGENTSILTSPDGVMWSLRTTGTQPLRAVAWGEGTFVAVGGEPPRIVLHGSWPQTIPGQPLVLKSRDGLVWTREDAPVGGQVSCVTFGAGRFVAGTTSMRTMVSTNGIEWLAGWESDSEYGPEFLAVAHVVDRFVATYGSASMVPGGFFASSDGGRWTSEPWSLDNGVLEGNVRALACGPHGAVGVARGMRYSFKNQLIASADGRVWHGGVRELTSYETAVTFAGGRFFLREQSGYANPYQQRTETTYLVSTDGQKWESTVVSDAESFGLPAYGNGVWVAGGSGGHVAWSTNAVGWQLAAAGHTNQLSQTAFAGGVFVTTGADGTLLTSADGRNWTRRLLETTNALSHFTWNGGVFVVAEAGTGVVFTSNDLIVWSRQPMPTNVTAIVKLAAWPEGFLALVTTGTYGVYELLRSTDGRSWLPETPPANDIARIATGGERLVAFRGDGSRTFHARNAWETNWTTHLLPWETTREGSVYYAPADVTFGLDTFLLTHSAGFILQSDPLTNRAPRLTQPLVVVAASLDAPVTLQPNAVGTAPLRYQWRQDGTNLPSATSPFLSMAARAVAAGRITVVIDNAFGSVESAAAAATVATPARLELAADCSSLRAWGTPNGRYRIEYTQDLSPYGPWSFFSEFEVSSWGAPAQIKNLWRFDYRPVPQRFYRASVSP